MKLYSVYSEENKILKDEWFLKTLQDNFEIHLKYLGKIAEGRLNCKEPAWYSALRKKSQFIFEAIQNNIGDVIIASDIDIQFFRKSAAIIKKYVRNKDVVFQAEHRPFDGQINTGFIAIKCNERTLQLWKYILNMEIEKMPFGDQSAINHVLKNKLVHCKWGVFPDSIWAYSQCMPHPINIVLHHANAAQCKEGQGSLDAKIDQLKMVKKEVLMKGRLTRFNKALICIRDRRIPYSIEKLWRDFIKNIGLIPYMLRLKAGTFMHNIAVGQKTKKTQYKCLYASPVGKNGKDFLAKIIQKFGYEDFDYLIFVYDDTEFEEEIFRCCKFIYEKGLRWYFMKKYVTPEYCSKYDYLFFWADDIDVDGFSYKQFLEIMQKNNLEIAQPALTPDSYFGVPMTVQVKKYKAGRYTDYVEQMIPVFTPEAWRKYWGMMASDYNFWGWGYGQLAKAYCKYKNMGIVDCTPVRHCRPVGSKLTSAPREAELFLLRNKGYRETSWISYGALR